MAKERISFYDNLKFFLILLVVIGHFILFQLDTSVSKGIFLFIYSFHMPLFIFVTGFFAKKIINGDSNNRVRKIVSYLLIYLLYKIFLFITMYLILRQPYNFSLFLEMDPPWYLMATVILIMLVTIFKNVNPKYMMAFSIICCLIVGYESNITDQFALSRVIVFAPFFLLGYYLSYDNLNYFINKLHQKKKNIILALIILILIFILFISFGNELYFTRGLLTARNPYVFLEIPFDIPLSGLFLRLLWLIYNIGIAIIIFTLIPRRETFFTKFGKQTLQVYVLHYFVIVIINYSFISSILENVFGIYDIIIYILLAVITTFILSIKIFGTPFDKIMGLKYKKII